MIGLLGLSVAGCARQHSIEPGTWRLAFQANPGSEQYAPPPAEVEVLVDWEKGEDAELVKVQYFPGQKGEGEGKPYTLEGRLDDGKIELRGTTRYWLVQVWGEVLSPFTLRGSAFARGRLEDDLYFDGTWRMVKVRPRQ